jgi:uncharacterized protein YfdQ (DUF2303 family)
MDNEPNIVESAVALASEPVVLTIADRPYVAVPSRFTLQDLEKTLPEPRRKAGTVYTDDAASFCALVNRHTNPHTVLYCAADYEKCTVGFKAVLNDHAEAMPGWGDHAIEFHPKKSVEWTRWFTANKQVMGQAEFAMFLEDNMRDITGGENMPSGAQMLEMALSMEATQDFRFKSSMRLQSGGQELAYVNREDDATMKRMQLFERFTLGLPPFFRGQAYRLDARLRYRIKEDRAMFWYELIRPDLVLLDAVEGLVATIKATVPAAVPFVFGRR